MYNVALRCGTWICWAAVVEPYSIFQLANNKPRCEHWRKTNKKWCFVHQKRIKRGIFNNRISQADIFIRDAQKFSPEPTERIKRVTSPNEVDMEQQGIQVERVWRHYSSLLFRFLNRKLRSACFCFSACERNSIVRPVSVLIFAERPKGVSFYLIRRRSGWTLALSWDGMKLRQYHIWASISIFNIKQPLESWFKLFMRWRISWSMAAAACLPTTWE